MRDPRFRRWDMQRRGGGDEGHRRAYGLRREDLRRQAGQAKARGCPYNLEADAEVDRGANHPTPSY